MPHLLHILAAFLTFLTATIAAPWTFIPDAVFINVEDKWDGLGTETRNKTFAFYLDTPWYHESFTDVGRIYLIGSRGTVPADNILCKPYWVKPNGMGYAGLWLSTRIPTSPHDVFADLSDASLQLTCSQGL